MLRRADHTACMGDMRNATVVRNLKGRYSYICEGDIKMDLKRVRVGGCGIYSFGSS
jgi:hypothetical protein